MGATKQGQTEAFVRCRYQNGIEISYSKQPKTFAQLRPGHFCFTRS